MVEESCIFIMQLMRVDTHVASLRLVLWPVYKLDYRGFDKNDWDIDSFGTAISSSIRRFAASRTIAPGRNNRKKSDNLNLASSAKPH